MVGKRYLSPSQDPVRVRRNSQAAEQLRRETDDRVERLEEMVKKRREARKKIGKLRDLSNKPIVRTSKLIEEIPDAGAVYSQSEINDDILPKIREALSTLLQAHNELVDQVNEVM
jgi:hypothetical protein